MKKKRLGVNIDHVATIRNARGEKYPDPLTAALLAQKEGASSITVHLREDRRHIKDFDLKKLKEKLKIPINLEMAPTYSMLRTALRCKPKYVCIVPEKRQEITTEGGLNVNKNFKLLKSIIKKLNKRKISVSLFIEPKISDIKLAKLLNVNAIELHTGKFCNLFNNKKNYNKEFNNLKKASLYADKIGLNVHAGHGITYESLYKLCKINKITEYNIGHFLISDSIFNGLPNVIRKVKKIIKL